MWKQEFQIGLILTAIPLGFTSVFPSQCQHELVKANSSRITVIQIVLAFKKVALQVEAVTLISTSVCCMACQCSSYKQPLQFSFISSYTPKTLASSFSFIARPFRLTVANRLKAFYQYVKCTSLYLQEANFNPNFFAQAAHLLCVRSSCQQFPFVLGLYASMLTSSINFILEVLILKVLQISRSFVL